MPLPKPICAHVLPFVLLRDARGCDASFRWRLARHCYGEAARIVTDWSPWRLAAVTFDYVGYHYEGAAVYPRIFTCPGHGAAPLRGSRRRAGISAGMMDPASAAR